MSSPRARPNAAAKAAKKTELAKRRLDITELLLLRLAQCQIAEKLELSEASVSETVREIRADWAERHKEKVDVIQARELAALDADETRVRKWLMASTPDQDRARGRYMEILLKIGERRAKIAGLDAPTKVENKVTATVEQPLALTGEDRDAVRELAVKVYGSRIAKRTEAASPAASLPTNGAENGNGTNGSSHP